MRRWIMAVAAIWAIADAAGAVDLKTLRRLRAEAPTVVESLPAGSSPRALQFLRIIIRPNDPDWGLAYESILLRGEDTAPAVFERLTWTNAVEEENAAFARAFEDELKKAGMATAGGVSLFDDASGSADLKVGVLVDDIQGRFCIDCPNLLSPKAPPATVMMTAHWEIYSSLDRKVMFRATTAGGANYPSKVQGTIVPAVMEAYRENVRRLIMNPEFRNFVSGSSSPTSQGARPPAPAALALSAKAAATSPSDAAHAVVVVFAADGSGSGFLVSDQGHFLTNHHVVGGSKYVKLKWDDGVEGLGEVLRADARRDVALIKAESRGRRPLAVRRAPVVLGEGVFAIGTPLEETLQNTMTKGIVSAQQRVFDGLPFIQSDVGVTHGNSGGPLLDEKGAVIGLTASGREINGAPVGLNFFIPIDDALKALAITPAN